MMHVFRPTFQRFTIAALSAVALASAASGEVPSDNVTTFEPTDTERQIFAEPGISFAEGADIYATVCAGCHMPEGQGAIGGGAYPALSGNENLEYPDYAIFIVTNGYKAMPSLGHLLDDEQVASLVNYLQSNLGNSYEPTATPDMVAANRPQPD